MAIQAKALIFTTATALACLIAAASASEITAAGQGEGKATSASSADETATAVQGYRLYAGDRLKIRFLDRYDREDLNGEYVINDNGQLRLPRIGVFDAQNKSTADLERDIQKSIENRGEKAGSFSIEISRQRPFYVVGLANRPGSYVFLPGLTVLHALSLAGGLYRSPLTSMADIMREKRTLTDNFEQIMGLLARRARLEAERNDSPSIGIPRELSQFEPTRAARLIENEQTVLQRSREADRREKAAFESVVALTNREIENYRSEIARIERRIEEQSGIFKQLKELHIAKVINQQRLFESISALDNLHRDKQGTLAGLARASTDFEKAQRDLSMLTLDRKVKVEKELTETQRELDRHKALAAQTRELVAGLDTLASNDRSGQIVSYKIMRRNSAGRTVFIAATETTPIMPGDVIEIESHPEAALAWLH